MQNTVSQFITVIVNLWFTHISNTHKPVPPRSPGSFPQCLLQEIRIIQTNRLPWHRTCSAVAQLRQLGDEMMNTKFNEGRHII